MNETESRSFVVVVNRDGMGQAEPDLRHNLAHTYFTMLLDNRPLPMAVCFYAEGVRLLVDGSPVLDVLRQLSEQGVYLIVCSTCLNHYNLRDQVRIGIVGGMHDILEAQMRADKVITL